MRILMVCEAFGGGVFHYVSQLCNDLCDRYEIYLAYAVRPKLTPSNYRELLDSRIHLIELKHLDVRRLTSVSADIRMIRELRAVEREVRPDVIHLHSTIAGGIGRIAYRKRSRSVIYTPHGYAHVVLGGGWKRGLYAAMEWILVRTGALTLTCCESEDEVARSLGRRTAYIETGVNLEALTRALDGIEPQKSERFTVFTLGRACAQKQPELFNEIALQVPQARFVWIGEGELANRLTAPNVEVTGWKPREEALAMAKGADVFILCSRGEAIAMSLLENMFIQKLCVVSDAVGNRSVIRDGENGYVCRAPEEYAARIRDAMRRFPEELTLQAYHEILSVYNTREMKRKFIEFYDRFAGERGDSVEGEACDMTT